MRGFFQDMFQMFFVACLLLLFIISIILLKPFKVHHKRPVTTISLKVSFIVFLGGYLLFTYLLLFGKKVPIGENVPYDSLFNIHFLLYLCASIIPISGIMIRRSIRKKRVNYNLLFIFVNLVFLGYIIFALVSQKWALI